MGWRYLYWLMLCSNLLTLVVCSRLVVSSLWCDAHVVRWCFRVAVDGVLILRFSGVTFNCDLPHSGPWLHGPARRQGGAIRQGVVLSHQCGQDHTLYQHTGKHRGSHHVTEVTSLLLGWCLCYLLSATHVQKCSIKPDPSMWILFALSPSEVRKYQVFIVCWVHYYHRPSSLRALWITCSK